YGIWASRVTYLFLRKNRRNEVRKNNALMFSCYFAIAISLHLGGDYFFILPWLSIYAMKLMLYVIFASLALSELTASVKLEKVFKSKLSALVDEEYSDAIARAKMGSVPTVEFEAVILFLDIRSFS